MRTLHHTHVTSHNSSTHRMTSVAAGEFPDSTVPITGEPKYTDSAEVYLQPMRMEQVDPDNRSTAMQPSGSSKTSSKSTRRRLLNTASTSS